MSACWAASTRPTLAVVGLELGERGPGALEGAVDRRHRGVEQLGHLGRLPAQHLAQDEHGALAGREVLERRDERQADGLPRRGQLGRVAVLGQDAVVGDGLDPGALGQLVAFERVGRAAEGPMSMGRARRWRLRSMSRHTLVAMR